MLKIGRILLQTLAMLVLLFVLLTGPVLIASSSQVSYAYTSTPTSTLISTSQSQLSPAQSPQPFFGELGTPLDEIK
ncbi:MAG: hypothetical protein JW908_12300 [Anaerolineales bacterium]|nr:hypothetical protein [Anaerolineales bacterium]